MSEGRFDAPFRMSAAPKLMLQGAWDGVRLRCPSCGKGRIYSSGFNINPQCSECGAPFERPNQGDFVGAMVTAYTITAVVVLVVIAALWLFTPIPARLLPYVSIPFVLIFVVALYRNMKGIWITFLIALTKWLR